jgi:hypothetical protein
MNQLMFYTNLKNKCFNQVGLFSANPEMDSGLEK